MHTFLGLGKLRLIGIILLSVLIPIGCNASDCPDLYPNNKPIEVRNTVELCNSFFVSVFDKNNQRVILVSEHLKHNGVGTVTRKDAFHSDNRVGKKPSPSQYTNSGYDKGHMAPAGDASNDQEMYETFLMTNMTPQEPTLNRQSWKELEEHTRTLLANSKSDMYIITFAIYADNKQISGIPIPTAYWKVVTIDGVTKYYYAPNTPHAKVVENGKVPILSLLPK
jgi:endonuclease G